MFNLTIKCLNFRILSYYLEYYLEYILFNYKSACIIILG